MKAQKKIHTAIILLLCLCILGFFANWAQNEYGLKLVGIALFGISILFATMAYLAIQHKQLLRIFLLFFYACLLFTTFFNAASLPKYIFVVAALLGIFGPQLFIPLAVALSERNTANKTSLFEYACASYLTAFCLGNYFKIHQLNGAAPLIVSSFLIIFPLFLKSVSQFRNKQTSSLLQVMATIFMLLFIATNILGYIFLTQHWPGGKIIVGVSFSLLLLLLFTILILKLKNTNLREWWTSQSWILRLSLICLSITSTHYILRKNKLAPAIYSSEYPKALQELWDKSNSITKEGIENEKKADSYYKNYNDFLDKREASMQ